MLTLLGLEGSPWIPAALEPVREDSSIEWHHDGIVVLDPVIECALHQAMSSKRGSDMSCEAVLRLDLHRLEIFDIFRIEEHPSDSAFLLVHLQWVTS